VKRIKLGRSWWSGVGGVRKKENAMIERGVCEKGK
jgi:hypothetical protein